MPKFLGKEKRPKQLKSFVAVFFPVDISPWKNHIYPGLQKLCCSPSIHTSVKSSPKITKMPKCLGKEIHPNHIKSVFTETENNLIK